MLHRVGRLVLLFSILALAAGCIGADEVDVGTEGDETISAASQGEAGWNLEQATTHEILVGAGVPYDQMVVAGESDCGWGVVEVILPEGAAFLSFEIEEPVVDTEAPGAGYITPMYRHETYEYWHDANGEPLDSYPSIYTDPPREEHSVNLTEPEKGSWFVWAWPHGPVVNQAVDIIFHAQGEGPPSGSIGESGRYGVEC